MQFKSFIKKSTQFFFVHYACVCKVKDTLNSFKCFFVFMLSLLFNRCSNINFARRLECNRCGEQKQPNVKKIKKGGVQIGKAAAEKSRGLFSADDWICKT